MILNTEHWYPVGRGHRFDYYATVEEIAVWLQELLPYDYAPYSLVALRFTPKGNDYTWAPVFGEIDELSKMDSFINIFIWSHEMLPELPLRDGEWREDLFDMNGMICCQPYLPWKDRDTGRVGRSRSSLVLTPRVVNDVTCETIHYTAAEKIFNRLKRGIRKRLPYASIINWTSREGMPEESTTIRMSEEIVRQIRNGEILADALPGKRIG